MKKFTAIFLSAALALSLSACNDPDVPDVDSNSEESSSRKPDSSQDSDASSNSSPSGSVSDPVSGGLFEPDRPKTIDIFDFLPEIPVTDISAFKYRYNDNKDGIVITDFLTDETKIRVPDTIEGKPVTAISLNEELHDDFGNYNDSSIYDDPLYKKYDITELILPDTVKTVSSSSRNMLHGYSYDAPALDKVEYINFPSELSYTNCAFASLKALYIDEGTTMIPYRFQQVSEKMYIPGSMRAFPKKALNCEITYLGETYGGYTDELHHQINDVHGDGFVVAEEKDPDGTTSMILKDFCSDRADAVIPNGVTAIDTYAFRGCDTIKTVTIPASVKELYFSGLDGIGCFDDCDNLTEVIFEKGSELNMINGFNNCPDLESVTIPDGVSVIGDDPMTAFSNCTALKSVSIPDSVNRISDGSFKGCTSITRIALGDNISTEIKFKEIFADCKRNHDLKILYKGLEYTEFDQIKKIQDGIITKDGFEIRNDVLYSYCGKENAVVIPDGVVKIGSKAFISNPDITSVTIPEGVTEIGDGAFWNCENLTSVKMPEGVTKIGASAFHNCQKLENITIPKSTTVIGSMAFYDCESLKFIELPDDVCLMLALIATDPESGETLWDNRCFYNCKKIKISYKNKTYDYDHLRELYDTVPSKRSPSLI